MTRTADQIVAYIEAFASVARGTPSLEFDLAELLVLAEAAKQRDELLAVLRGYERWEADMLMNQEAWVGGLAEFPALTQELWDGLLTLQAQRNAAIARAESTAHGPAEGGAK